MGGYYFFRTSIEQVLEHLSEWLFSLAALWSCYNKRQQTADGVAARQQPGSLFSTEGLSKRPHSQNSSWWILWRTFVVIFHLKKKTTAITGDGDAVMQELCLGHKFEFLFDFKCPRTATFLFFPPLSTASFGSLRARRLQRWLLFPRCSQWKHLGNTGEVVEN